jgi:hypothetical protein
VAHPQQSSTTIEPTRVIACVRSAKTIAPRIRREQGALAARDADALGREALGFAALAAWIAGSSPDRTTEVLPERVGQNPPMWIGHVESPVVAVEEPQPIPPVVQLSQVARCGRPLSRCRTRTRKAGEGQTLPSSRLCALRTDAHAACPRLL